MGALRQQPGAGYPCHRLAADGDPIYLNGAYNDPFISLLILDGTLMPKN
ncbi:MAG: hypothetical protein R3A10_09130 [Caldilineaceae bacterium]